MRHPQEAEGGEPRLVGHGCCVTYAYLATWLFLPVPPVPRVSRG